MLLWAVTSRLVHGSFTFQDADLKRKVKVICPCHAPSQSREGARVISVCRPAPIRQSIVADSK